MDISAAIRVQLVKLVDQLIFTRNSKKQLIINRYNTYPRMDISAGAAARVQTVNLVDQLILTRYSYEQVFSATGRNLKK